MAKTYRRLWDKFVSRENFDDALAKALKNKFKTAEIQKFMSDPADNLDRVRRLVESGGFRTSEYRRKIIFEPKKREIFILPFCPDRIVHHALMNVLIPIWNKMFIADSYACRPGKGIHGASRRVMGIIRKNRYYLQCDIRKFYPSINHGVLLEIISRKIRDRRLMEVVADIVKSSGGETNIPIGNFCSQWFGNLYLNELDTFVKQTLRAKDYARYCDDFVLAGNDKKILRGHLEAIRNFLSEKLKLEFSYAEIAPTARGMDYIGYRHFPEFILIRKRTAARMKKMWEKIKEIPPELRNSDPYTRGRMAAMNGWLKHASTHNLRKKMGFKWKKAKKCRRKP